MGGFAIDADCGAAVEYDDARVGVNRRNEPVAKITTKHESSCKVLAPEEVHSRDVSAKTDRKCRCARDVHTFLVCIRDARPYTA